MRRAMWMGACFAVLGMAASNELIAFEIKPEFVMFQDPQLASAVEIKQLDDRLLPLWREVLLRSEVDYQRQAAEAIAHAAEEGFPGMEAAAEDLHTLLTTAEHPASRFAAAHALIVLDARTSADALFELSQAHDSQLRMLVEPALADWEYEPIRDVWRGRIRDPNANRRELIMALEGLAQANDAGVLDEMLEIVVTSNRSPDVRLSAARAAGAVSDSGLEETASRLMSITNSNVMHRLCAVALLARHDSQQAQKLLAQLAIDVEPTVAEQALAALHSIDPQLVFPLAEQAMQNPDPKVRQRGADAYVALPTPDRVVVLSLLLDDPHPDVRGSVREDMFLLAQKPNLDEAVRGSAMDMLGGESWRGQEQAALLLAALDHKPAAARLVELLRSPRAEVMVATGWALRVLAIEEMLPAMLEHAQFQTDEREAGRGSNGLDLQVAHLFEAMGQMNYLPAEDLLREYIPKRFTHGEYSRATAIWTLGRFHAGDDDKELAAALAERMNDIASRPPDLHLIFFTSALSLGRMQARSQLSALNWRLENTHPTNQVAFAVRWSIHEITGEEFPEPDPIIRGRTGWFLEPLPDAPSPNE